MWPSFIAGRDGDASGKSEQTLIPAQGPPCFALLLQRTGGAPKGSEGPPALRRLGSSGNARDAAPF